MTALIITDADVAYLNREAVLWAKLDEAADRLRSGQFASDPSASTYAAMCALLEHLALPERPAYAPTQEQLLGDSEALAEWRSTIAF